MVGNRHNHSCILSLSEPEDKLVKQFIVCVPCLYNNICLHNNIICLCTMFDMADCLEYTAVTTVH
jgi:hypothetical protein